MFVECISLNMSMIDNLHCSYRRSIPSTEGQEQASPKLNRSFPKESLPIAISKVLQLVLLPLLPRVPLAVTKGIKLLLKYPEHSGLYVLTK